MSRPDFKSDSSCKVHIKSMVFFIFRAKCIGTIVQKQDLPIVFVINLLFVEDFSV